MCQNVNDDFIITYITCTCQRCDVTLPGERGVFMVIIVIDLSPQVSHPFLKESQSQSDDFSDRINI